MLKIRLSRGGRKKLPFYRILVTNVTSPRDSKFLEKVGTYNPLLAKDNENRVTIQKDRIEYWLGVGAIPTEKVAKFLIALGVKGAEKHAPNYKPKQKGEGLKKKALEKIAKEKEAAEAAAAEAAAEAEAKKAEEAAAVEAAKAAEETPAESVSKEPIKEESTPEKEDAKAE
ncbi:MAG: 30S ribosomal protein S16 [Rickettsiales bacterium]|nr:30S ribosomal protein S16 [Rickettsiales bacterium]